MVEVLLALYGEGDQGVQQKLHSLSTGEAHMS